MMIEYLFILQEDGDLSTVAHEINTVIDNLKHPFVAVILGLFMWFAMKWSWYRDSPKKGGYFNDQKDEMVVSLIGGLIFLIFDDEIIVAYHEWMEDGITTTELKFYYYFMVGPGVERIYKIKQIYLVTRRFLIRNLSKGLNELEKKEQKKEQ